MLWNILSFYCFIGMKKEKNCECINDCSHDCNWCGCKCMMVPCMIAWGIVTIATLILSYITYNNVNFLKENVYLQAGGVSGYELSKQIYSHDVVKNQIIEQAQSYYDSLDTIGEETEESFSYLTEDWKTEVENLLSTVPVRGAADARFTIIEYTELLCPYCQRHSQAGTINTVIDTFPGEVNSLSRHFLIHGEPALKLSAAMECVAETNPEVFYDVMEQAFNTENLDVDALVGIAATHGVNTESMRACVNEGRYEDSVNQMMETGNRLFGVNGTPGNVIIDRETGAWKLISGAYPVDSFVEVINTMKNS